MNIFDCFISLKSNCLSSCKQYAWDISEDCSILEHTKKCLLKNQTIPNWRFFPSHPQKSLMLLWLSVTTKPIDLSIHYSHHCHLDYNTTIMHMCLLNHQNLHEDNKWHSHMHLKSFTDRSRNLCLYCNNLLWTITNCSFQNHILSH